MQAYWNDQQILHAYNQLQIISISLLNVCQHQWLPVLPQLTCVRKYCSQFTLQLLFLTVLLLGVVRRYLQFKFQIIYWLMLNTNCLKIYLHRWFCSYEGQDSSVGTATRYGLGARFSAPVQTGPRAHPTSCAMGTGFFPGEKRPGRSADHPPTYVSAEVMKG